MSAEIILQRELLLDGRPLRLTISKPHPFPPNDDFECHVVVTPWANGEIKLRASGDDSLDAVINAIRLIATRLMTSAEYRSGRLEWLGGKLGLEDFVINPNG